MGGYTLAKSMDGSLGETTQVDFSLSFASGTLKASVLVPVGKVTLTQLLPALQSLSSSIAESASEAVRNQGQEVSCRAGCGACCRQLVPLSLFEAEALAGYIRSLSEPEQEQLEGRFDAALSALGESGLLARMDPAEWVNGSPAATALAIDYLKQGVACPFLVDERCSIHPIRPFTCREYLVTSPAEFCAAPADFPVVGVPVPVRLSTAASRLGAMVEKGSAGWFPLVFLFAWMRSLARPGNAIQGTGPELLAGVLKVL